MYLDKTIVQKDACSRVFLAALFTIASTWKQPKCPSTEDKEDVPYICNGILFSHKKEIMPFATTWVDPVSVILSEVGEDT